MHAVFTRQRHRRQERVRQVLKDVRTIWPDPILQRGVGEEGGGTEHLSKVDSGAIRASAEGGRRLNRTEHAPILD